MVRLQSWSLRNVPLVLGPLWYVLLVLASVIVYHSQIRPCVKWTYNVHIYIYIYIYIYINTEYRNLETRKTLTASLFRYETFYYLLSLNVFLHKEREAQSFYSGFFICSPISCDTCPKPLRASESQPSCLVSSLNSTL